MSYPVTADQRRLLERLSAEAGARRVGGGPINLIYRAYLVKGALRLEALAHAGEMVLARHPALKVTFRRRAGEWRTCGDEDPTIVVQTSWHGELPATAAELARAVVDQQELILPEDTPRFRLHVQTDYPAVGQAVIVVTADRLVADDRSMNLLAATLATAYNHQLNPSDPAYVLPGVATDRWRKHVEALSARPEPAAGLMPPWWRKLHQHVAYHGRADVDLPLAVALDTPLPAAAGGEALIETATVAADVDRLAVTVADAARVGVDVVTMATIADPIAEAAGDDARLQLEIDTRTVDELGTIGSYTAGTVLQIPPLRNRSDVAGHLQLVQQLYGEATDPFAGLAWTELLQAAADAHPHAAGRCDVPVEVLAPAPARRPTVAVAHRIPAPLRLSGLDVTALPPPPDVAGGRIVYEFDHRSLRLHWERGRFPEGLGTQLADGVTEALRSFHTAVTS